MLVSHFITTPKTCFSSVLFPLNTAGSPESSFLRACAPTAVCTCRSVAGYEADVLGVSSGSFTAIRSIMLAQCKYPLFYVRPMARSMGHASRGSNMFTRGGKAAAFLKRMSCSRDR